MSTQEFKELINDPYFPAELLKSEGEDRLYAEFKSSPAQFARNALYAFARSVSKWDTPEGQELLQKLNLTKADVVKWSK